MNISKNHFRVILFIPCLALLLLTQCKDPQPRYQDELTAHFGEVNYQRVEFEGKARFDLKEPLFIAKGVAQHKSDTIPSFSWFMVANAAGKLGDLYVGSANTSTSGVVQMSAGDYVAGVEKCYAISSSDGGSAGSIIKRNNCLNQLNVLALIECVLASDGSSEFSCATDCWMNNSQCF